MIKRGFEHLLLLCVLACPGAPCTAASPAEHTGILRNWVLSLHSWAVPRYANLLASATQLSDTLDSVCMRPPTPKSIAALQSRWVGTMLQWRELEALQFGPTLTRRSSKIIDFWPTRPSVIELAVAATKDQPVSGADADEAMQRWGTAAKGLPALEWLVYAEAGQTPPILRTPGHCLYARRLARGVVDESSRLHAAWQLESARWATASASELQTAAHDVLNLLVGSCELIRGKKMQKAAQLVALRGRDSAPANAFDSTRSAKSRRFLLAHFDGLAQMLVGHSLAESRAANGPGISLVDVLKLEGHEELARELTGSAKRASVALVALPASPLAWSIARMTTATDALRDLRAVLDPRISVLLGVTVTFSDADGD